jgi:hypothetical protein
MGLYFDRPQPAVIAEPDDIALATIDSVLVYPA